MSQQAHVTHSPSEPSPGSVLSQAVEVRGMSLYVNPPGFRRVLLAPTNVHTILKESAVRPDITNSCASSYNISSFTCIHCLHLQL